MTIGDRIKLIRKSEGITQLALAEKIGLKRNTIASYEIGTVAPSDRTISDICRAFGIDENWLRTGDGDMYAKLSEDTQLSNFMEQIKDSDDDFIKGFIKKYWELTDEEKAVIRKMSEK